MQCSRARVIPTPQKPATALPVFGLGADARALLRLRLRLNLVCVIDVVAVDIDRLITRVRVTLSQLLCLANI